VRGQRVPVRPRRGSPSMTAQEVVSGELHIDRIAAKIADKAVRDQLHQAARLAERGQTVWLVRDGTRIGALVSVERASASLLVPVNEAEDVW
jgi:hypothetical protein